MANSKSIVLVIAIVLLALAPVLASTWGSVGGANSWVNLSSPVNQYNSSSVIAKLNCSVSIYGGGTVRNITLWTNTTNAWRINQTVSYSTSAVDSTVGATKSGSGTGRIDGVKITPAGQSVLLTKVTKYTVSTATTARLRDASQNIIASATFSGDEAVFSYTLMTGTYYYVTADSGGAGFNVAFNDAVTYPIAGSNINYTIGLSNGVENAANLYHISSLTTTGNSNYTQQFNLQITAPTLWSCSACDSDGVCGYGSTNRTINLNAQPPVIIGLAPNGTIPFAYYGKNMSLNYSIYNVSSSGVQTCWYNYGNATNYTIPCTQNSTIILNNGKNITFYANDTANNIGQYNMSWDYTYFIGSEKYNASTYETKFESFQVPSSTMTSATLMYNGTAYPATVSNGNATVTFDVPTVNTWVNNTFYWMFNGGVYNSTPHNQSVGPILFTLCNSSTFLPFVNFTFKDENSLALVNAATDLASWTYYMGSGTVTKSYLFTNTSVNPSYGFCFSPQSGRVYTSVTYQYSGTGYPQRYYSSTDTLTNSSTNKVLYLLASADGIYSTFIVDNQAFAPLQGANIKVYRDFSSVATLISEGNSGSDGGVTFWLNPNYDHTLVVSKTGYQTQTITIRPSQSTYSIMLASLSGNASFAQYLSGAKWNHFPAQGILLANTTYTFGLNINYSLGGMVSCRVDLTNQSGTVLSTASGCTSYGGTVSFAYNVGDKPLVVLKSYIDIGDGEVVLDPISYWIDTPTNSTSFKSIRNFLGHLNTFSGEWGANPLRQSFSQIVMFFFIICILLAALNIYTGIDIANPTILILILCALVNISSVGGLFNIPFYNGATDNEIWETTWLTKYAVAGMFDLFVFAFILNKFRRENT